MTRDMTRGARSRSGSRGRRSRSIERTRRRVAVDDDSLQDLKETMQELLSEVRSMRKELQEATQAREQDRAQLDALSAENAWLKHVVSTQTRLSRQPRITTIEKNVILFPVKDADGRTPQSFQSATSDAQLNATLGLPSSETLVVERNPSWVKVSLPNMQRKSQLMKYPARSTLRQQHKIVLKEELLPEEQEEQQYLRKTMAVLYQHNLRPTWRRSAVVWRDGDKQGMLTVLDVPAGMTDDAILAKARSMMQPVPQRPSRMDIPDPREGALQPTPATQVVAAGPSVQPPPRGNAN